MTLVLPTSLAERYEAATPAARKRAIKLLSLEQQQQLASGRPWWWEARGDQLIPAGDWRWWVINAGRGWGKTRTGAETTLSWARRYPGCRICLVAPTFGDGRDTMVEGESGILACLGNGVELRGSSIDTGWNRSMGELFLANGSRMKIFSSDQPMRLRGPQHHFGWGDEPSYWADVNRGTDRDSTWSNMNIGLRLRPRRGWDEGYQPRGVLTMTPRMVPLLKVPEEVIRDRGAHVAGLLQRDDVSLTTGATAANLRNLDDHYYKAVIEPLLNTTLGLQELGGVLLEEVQGALWTGAQLARLRVDTMPAAADLAKTVVAFDPAGGEGLTHDEHGIVVASSSGTKANLAMWVREDYSLAGSVDLAAQRVLLAAWEFSVDAIVYEKNQGQDWVGMALRSTYDAMSRDGYLASDGQVHPAPWVNDGWRLPTIEPVPAIKSKLQRATPVRGWYEQQRVRHVGHFPTLEGQMTTWVPGDSDSPDRLDALVWALTWLYGTGPGQAQVASSAQRERRGRRADQPSSRMPAVYGYRGRRG